MDVLTSYALVLRQRGGVLCFVLQAGGCPSLRSSFSLPATCWILPQKQIQLKDVLVLL